VGVLALALGIVLGFAGSIPAAGPLLFLVLASGLEGDRRRALALAAGGALAESVYVGLAFWGLAEVFARHEGLTLWFRIASVVLLAALGAALLRRKAASSQAARARARSFVTGLALVGLNPAFLATWSAVAALCYGNHWLRPEREHVPWLAAGAFVGVVAWFAGVAWLAERYRERFRPETLARVVRGFGALLIALSGWMLVSSLLR